MESSTIDEPKPTTVRSLNDFPEHLLLEIISFLPTIDAIKASFISRRWRNLWSSISSLNFSYDDFPPSSSPDATRRRFADSVNQSLLLRSPQSPPLLAFRLLFDFGEIKYTSFIESWIQYAVNHRVVELDVDFFPNRESRWDFLDGLEKEPCFDFLFHELQNSQVRVLRLSRCYLYWPDYMSSLRFDSMRSVSIDQSYLEDAMLSDLLNGCPNLESLSLRYCWGMENGKYFGSNIKTLSLKNFNGVEGSSSVEIDCPNLVYLEMDSYVVEKYTLNYSPALVETSVYFAHTDTDEYCGAWSKVVRLVGHVEKLTMQNWWYKLLEENDFFSAGFKLYNLRWLELKTKYTKSELLGIAVLLELSPNLETLILDYLEKINKADYETDDDDGDDDDDDDKDDDEDDDDDDKDDDDDDDDDDKDDDEDDDEDEDEDEKERLSDELLNKPINFSLPKLRQVKMKAFQSTENEYLLLDLLKKQGVVCQKIKVIYLQNCDGSIYPPEVWVRNRNGTEGQGSSPHWEKISSN